MTVRQEEERTVKQEGESGLVEVEWWGERRELSLWEQLLLPPN